MPRALWQDPYAAQAIDLLQEPSRARAEAVRQIGNANARAAETAGAANANAQLQSGAAWANGIQQAGGAIAAIPGNIQQLQAQSRAEQMQKLALAQAQRQDNAQQRLEETRRNIGALMNDTSIINEDGTFNGKGILAKLSSALPNGASGPVQAPDPSIVFGIIDPINESLMRSRKLEMEFNEHKTNTIAQLASSILKLGEKSGNYLENAQLGLAAAVKSGVINQEQANSFLLPMVERPEIVPTLLANIAARSTLKKEAPTEASLAYAAAGGDQQAAGAMGILKPPPVRAVTEASLAADLASDDPKVRIRAETALKALKPGPSATDTALKEAQLKEINAKLTGTLPLSAKDRAELEIQRAKLANEDQAPRLSPEALKLTAQQYAMTGQLPPMGMGKAGAAVRTQIINQAADEYKTLDLASQQAAYKANQASLRDLQGTADKVSAFESTAGKNLDNFLSLAAKIPDTGVPWLNAPIRSLDARVIGSENMAAANAARDVALREIARVTNDPKLSGVLSDSARREVSALSPQDATFAQIKAVAKVLKQDMSNVHSSLNEQIGDIKQRIATPPGSPTTAPPAKVGRFNPVTGKVEY